MQNVSEKIQIDNLKENFSKKLKTARIKAHLSQKQVADQIDLERSTYAYYETGRTIPSVINLIKISKVLNVDLNYLVSS